MEALIFDFIIFKAKIVIIVKQFSRGSPIKLMITVMVFIMFFRKWVYEI